VKDKTIPISLSMMLITVGASCGFKSDLYLSDQPEEIGQFDTESLKGRGETELRQLKNQTDEPEVVGNSEQISDDGLIVDVPREGEIVPKKADLKKESAD